MRIVLSRKGFDSTAGGVPSPIIGNELVSLPIPAASSIQYRHLRWGGHTYGKLVEDLSNARISKSTQAHLDPDLRRDVYPRQPGWRPIFGQGEPASKKHLCNCGVTTEDLFLFYGWFRCAEYRNGKFQYVKAARDLHVIFGWLQVAAVIPCDDSELSNIPWALYHPHFESKNGIAYISRKRLSVGGSPATSGGGFFKRYNDSLCLTDPSSTSRRNWRMPKWFRAREDCFPLSYHTDSNRYVEHDNYTMLQSVDRGQEFVIDTSDYPEAIGWASRLIERATTRNRI